MKLAEPARRLQVSVKVRQQLTPPSNNKDHFCPLLQREMIFMIFDQHCGGSIAAVAIQTINRRTGVRALNGLAIRIGPGPPSSRSSMPVRIDR
jgi:hypothetical protein